MKVISGSNYNFENIVISYCGVDIKKGNEPDTMTNTQAENILNKKEESNSDHFSLIEVNDKVCVCEISIDNSIMSVSINEV